MRISLILVATVARYSSDMCTVARRTDAWGYAGAEPGTRPETVRGPPPPCSTDHCARGRRGAVESGEQGGGLVDGEAPVDVDRLTGDVARRGPGQEHGGAGEVLRDPVAAHQRAGRQRRHPRRVRGEPGVERG